MRELIILLTIALLFRLIAVTQYEMFLISDAKAYYEISENLEPVLPQHHHWYSWSPAHVLWLHITHRSLIAIIAMSLITVFILYRINPVLGWIWALYPMAIVFSVSYLKENTLFFVIACLLWLCHYRSKYSILLLYLVMLLFTGNSINHALDIGQDLMTNFWEIIKPDFSILTYYGTWVNYVLAIPYAVFIIYFIRNTKLTLITIVIILYLIIYSVLYGNSRYREPLMMLMFYDIVIHKSKQLKSWKH